LRTAESRSTVHWQLTQAHFTRLAELTALVFFA
jgi:hypothetical protein